MKYDISLLREKVKIHAWNVAVIISLNVNGHSLTVKMLFIWLCNYVVEQRSDAKISL